MCAEAWVPLSYGSFASGKNRYLLNYVRIQHPYGSLAAYLFRYDDPVVDWHQAAVCDIFPWPTPSRVWWACEACTPMKSWTPTRS